MTECTSTNRYFDGLKVKPSETNSAVVRSISIGLSETINMRYYLTVLLLVISSTATAAGYGSLQIDSGEQQVALIELYTSEGCSSCPPADRWMTALKDEDGLWRDYVPIALHVDYWNYIGWTDRFSKQIYTNRQRQYVRDGNVRVAYTPGFFANGEEWRGWFSGDELTMRNPSVGNLSLGLEGESIAVRFDPIADVGEKLVVNIAILGMQLVSDVQAGENNGKELKHDFVALNIQTVVLDASANGFRALTQMNDIDSETNELALAAWVATADNQTPLQTVGGYLPNSTH